MRTETQTTRTKKTLRSPVKRAAAKSTGVAKKAKTAGATVKTAKKASKSVAKKAAPKVTTKKAAATSTSLREKMTKKISANKKSPAIRELPEEQTEESSRTSMTEQPKMRLSRKDASKGQANQLRERQRRESLPENHVNPALRQR